MTSHNEPVQPARFDVADSAPAEDSATPVTHPAPGSEGRWIMPVLGLLIALAFLVIFWLPGKIAPSIAPAVDNNDSKSAVEYSPGETAARGEPSSKTTDGVAAPEQAADKSPWADAQQARLRLEAQDILAELLDLQFALEEQGVEAWAPGVYADARANAAEGDRLYRSQRYTDATVEYRKALTSLQTLSSELPQLLEQKLRETASSIARGDTAGASAALAAASAMDPENKEIPALRARLDTLPEVLENLGQASKREAEGELDAAAQLLAANLALDPLHKSSAQTLDRLRVAIRERDFQGEMSRGYALLDAAQFTAAQAAFNTALELRPDSAEAKSALLEVEAAATNSSLAALQRKGAALQQQERWSDAQAVYERALKIDDSVLFAKEGMAKASERARLDKQFRSILEEPARLEEPAVAQEASDFLRHARQIKPSGKLLQSQISRLDELLRLANTPVPVTLRSDGETEVTVYKVARLGGFRQHELDLRPGKYTAVGTRVGYRDVRREFQVQHNEEPLIVTVVCSDPI